jgi:hypothetical protein
MDLGRRDTAVRERMRGGNVTIEKSNQRGDGKLKKLREDVL